MTHHSQAISHLQRLLDAYTSHSGVSPTRLMVQLANDGKLAGRIRNGEDMRLSTYFRLLRGFASLWPADLTWPDDVPRPH